MLLETLLKKIEQLKAQADSYKPLNPEQNTRLQQKLRFDWNYHSNHLAGNSLNDGETKNLLLFSITARGKLLKDHLEIQGHDDAIQYLINCVENREHSGITQDFICNLHRLIFKASEYQIDTQDSAGKKIKCMVKTGEYKKYSNYVETATGTTLYFASPEETPAKMMDLIEWFHTVIADKTQHPLLIAATFHYRFMRIHPFDSGNGRVARLLMNYIFMRYDFPPLIIPSEACSKYLQALEYSESVDNMEEFAIYLGNRLIASLELCIKAAKGEAIEESDNFDKALNLLKRRFPPKKLKTLELQESVVSNCLIPFFSEVIRKLEKLDEFFLYKEAGLEFESCLNMANLFNKFRYLSKTEIFIKKEHLATYILLDYRYKQAHYDADFNLDVRICVIFNDFDYVIKTKYPVECKFYTSYYNQLFEELEIQAVSHDIARKVLEELEKKINPDISL